MIGITMCIGFSIGGLNTTGLALAFMAALTCAFLMVGTGEAMREGDSLVVLMLAMASTTLAICYFVLWNGQVALPTTSLGWTGFLGVAIAYTIGALTFFVAVPILGAVRAVMVSNIEPVLGVLFAVILVGESISPLRGVAICLVLGSIAYTELSMSLAGITSALGAANSIPIVMVAVDRSPWDTSQILRDPAATQLAS